MQDFFVWMLFDVNCGIVQMKSFTSNVGGSISFVQGFWHSEGTQRVCLLPSYCIVNMNHSLLMLFYVSYVDGALDQCCLLSHLRFLWNCIEENHER